MMNPYLHRLKRIEFIVTYGCTGKCRHCSQGDHKGRRESIDEAAAVRAVHSIAGVHRIESLMTFGGEPLLHPGTVCAIHRAAAEAGIPRRQLITNGFFSLDPGQIRTTARELGEAGVNDVLLSVDAFHQETIPLAPVTAFAQALLASNVPVRIQPAWLVSREDDNQWNEITRTLLDDFSRLGVSPNQGNVIFPEGNALKYLSEYFDPAHPVENPYIDDPYDLRAVSIEPDGTLLDGSIRREDAADILDRYHP